jgi:hypothetical protein
VASWKTPTVLMGKFSGSSWIISKIGRIDGLENTNVIFVPFREKYEKCQ